MRDQAICVAVILGGLSSTAMAGDLVVHNGSSPAGRTVGQAVCPLPWTDL